MSNLQKMFLYHILFDITKVKHSILDKLVEKKSFCLVYRVNYVVLQIRFKKNSLVKKLKSIFMVV